MRQALSIQVTFVLGLLIYGGWSNLHAEKGTESRLLVFKPAPANLDDCPAPTFSPFIINGRKVSRKEYPALFYDFAAGEAPCSGTLVGPRVLLTAAHCIDAQATPIRIETAEQVSYDGLCMRSPHYFGNRPDDDIALCLLTKEVEDIEFEPILTSADSIETGQWARLTGFGCCSSRSEGFGILRVGDAKITDVPGQDSGFIQTTGTAVICQADSGGPAYLMSRQDKSDEAKPSARDTRGPVVGVNSSNCLETNQSRIASLSLPRNVEYIHRWAGTHQVQICGITAQTPRCRQPR